MTIDKNQAVEIELNSDTLVHKVCDSIVNQVGRVILGKREQIQIALCCLIAEGHLLIEDIPGIGKTTLAKVLAESLGLEFRRIQCTSDMLPGDILGVSVFEQKTASFKFHPGPIFTQVLLSDEINRATPKTQSALLEAMEERQVTIEGETRPLSRPFFVIATQNPLEQAGTFPLPESQLDRFLIRIEIGYPDRASEKDLLRGGGTQDIIEEIEPLVSPTEVISFQQKAAAVHVSDALVEYVQDLVDYTRTSPVFHIGLSPRAGLSILRAARSWAFILGRDYVLPEDVQKMLPYVVGHRLRQIDGQGEVAKDELMELFLSVPLSI